MLGQGEGGGDVAEAAGDVTGGVGDGTHCRGCRSVMVPESGWSNEPGETRTAIGAMGIKPIWSGWRLEPAVDGAVGVGTSGWRLDPARGRSKVDCTLMRFASWSGWLSSSSESKPRSAVGDGGPRSLGAGRLGWLAAVMSL